MLAFAELRLEIYANPEDGASEREALCHVPEHAICDVALGKEGNERQYHARHHHHSGGHVLDPFFAVCSHKYNFIGFMLQRYVSLNRL